ncbi:uncharacterized protein DUF397 [Tamaricihabitans halophyticus]|uniref:Uncharacterized protein DUF397 n=1 Tax=Tamaricihabitans halophyticus TaxID=1262583 RepID=A0A4R2QIM2_9PSEU|nr:DUF397 domain-containing protein [Tamaricihabitans halophyticus]TCP49203.1 uncharacterized protein DUF397 [Tamaricihabitans halophyticus]
MAETYRWRKSSYSANHQECVEIGLGVADIGVRDTKNRSGGQLRLSRPAWIAFLRDIAMR